MKKCCFIIPYFGRFPSAFPMFLKSCEINYDYDWLIFTDDLSRFEYPDNVKVVFETFNDFINRIERKLQIRTDIIHPHKLCDFKPAYGLICEEYIADYQSWGFCDIDLIFGNLNHFITDKMMEKYDKMFLLGHFQIFKNNKENNRAFMNAIDGEYWWKDSFVKKETTVFDEVGAGERNINTIFKLCGKTVFEEDYSMNPKIAPANFIRTKYSSSSKKFIKEKFKNALYIWNRGLDNGIFRYYMIGRTLVKEEFMYMHFQQREMQMFCDLNCSKIKILGNGFYNFIEDEIDRRTFYKEKKLIFSLRFFYITGKWKFHGLMKKLGIK